MKIGIYLITKSNNRKARPRVHLAREAKFKNK
jgi:hypothetical protein